MIKGYRSKLEGMYEKIRSKEERELALRKDEIQKKHPEIIQLENQIAKMCLNISLNAIRGGEDVDEKLNNLKSSINELRARKIELLVSNGYPQDYLDMHYKCPVCKDTGYIGTKQCSCYKRHLIRLHYHNSELSDALLSNNFKNFDINLYSQHKLGNEKYSPRRNMEEILNYVLNEYIPNFKNTNDNLLLYGNSGTGKTFLSHCIAKDLLDKGYVVVYRTSDELISNLKELKFEKNDMLEDLLVNCDLLIIDDLGAEQVTDFTVTELFTLLNKKLIKHKKMLISTNLNLSDIPKTYTERISSRLLGNFKLLKFFAEDIRVQLNLRKNR